MIFTVICVQIVWANKKGGIEMLFGPSIFLAASATIVIGIADKACEEFGIHWLGIVLKIAIPLAGMALGVYFLETNPIVWWLR